VADIVERKFGEMGFLPVRKGNNVWAMATEYDAEKPTILLDAHLDTVKPNSSWVRNPFEPTIEGDRLYGLGSNDTGGSLVAMMAAFSHLAKKEQPYNLIMLCSAEEEVTGVGGVRAVLSELPKIDFAIVGEPTSMQPAIAEKGLMVFDCVTRGKAGHAARNEGENAIYKAMCDIERLRNFRFERTSEQLGEIKISVTQITAGTQHNIVPDECRFVADVRTTDAYSNEEVVAILQEALECDAVPRSTRVRASAIALSHPLVAAAKAIGCEAFVSPTTSDRAIMQGLAALKMGVGDSSRSHTADEYVLLSEIEESITIYQQLLDELKHTI
jgi:acetylornithine deacetylase